MTITRRDKIKFTIFALSAILYFPFSEWLAIARFGTSLLLWGQLIYFLPILIALFATPVLLFRLSNDRTRRESFFYLLISLLLIACCISGIVLGKQIRMAGMRSFAIRSQSLIQAIENFERNNSSPPQSLEDLVPNYLSTIPSTGMMAYPKYRYHVGDEAKEKYAGNPWALSVFTPSGGINFDLMLYFPNQNYPTHGYGGTLQPIGDWTYVHE